MSNRPCCSPPLRLGVWNARLPKTKVSLLCDLLLSRSLDHLSVTESWLTSNDSIIIANLTNSLEDYAVYHLPRSTRRGGGLAVIARKGRSWLLHPVNSLFVVISTFTSMTTQMQTPNNFLTFFFCWSVIPSSSSSGTHLGTSRRDVKTPFVLWNAP